MNTVGIVAEYNPLHNGHAWQIQAVREQFSPDCAIVVAMSGCFTQRGEPALLDKWARARAALACGASLVLELPFAYATASAERFAAGGVRLLAATGITRTLVFGSESGDLPLLQRLADILTEEPPEFRRVLQAELDEGQSFAAARQKALAAVLDDPAEAAVLRQANNILAIEYLKAIRRLPAGQRMHPVTIQRRGQGYLDPALTSPLASATAIRQAVSRSPSDLARLLQDLAPSMPAASLAVLLQEIASRRGPVLTEDLAPALIDLLRTRPIDQLEQVPGMQEGLARRLAAAARRPADNRLALSEDPSPGRLASLVAEASSRRLPQTRVQRALLAMLAGLTQADLDLFDASGGPAYLRVLGFDKQGRYLLRLMREKARLPLITKGSDFLEYSGPPALLRQAELDTLATDLWMVAAGDLCGRDFDRSVVIR